MVGLELFGGVEEVSGGSNKVAYITGALEVHSPGLHSSRKKKKLAVLYLVWPLGNAAPPSKNLSCFSHIIKVVSMIEHKQCTH